MLVKLGVVWKSEWIRVGGFFYWLARVPMNKGFSLGGRLIIVIGRYMNCYSGIRWYQGGMRLRRCLVRAFIFVVVIWDRVWGGESLLSCGLLHWGEVAELILQNWCRLTSG